MRFLALLEMTKRVKKKYYVYILSNKSHTVFYTGISSNLVKRIYEHRAKLVDGFTKKYNISKLLYFEQHDEVMVALQREKQIKDYRREKKFEFIKSVNSEWKDLWDEISH